MKTFALFVAVLTVAISQSSGQVATIIYNDPRLASLASSFNANIATTNQLFVDSSNRVRTSLKTALDYQLAGLKQANDALKLTINSFPYSKITDTPSQSVLRTVYTIFTTDSVETLNYVQSLSNFAPENGAIKNFDSTPPPSDVQVSRYCRHYQGAINTVDDGFISDEQCAIRELAKVPNHLSFFEGFFKDFSQAENTAKANISLNAVAYQAAITSSTAFLKTEEARLKKCYTNVNVCVKALLSSQTASPITSIKDLATKMAKESRASYLEALNTYNNYVMLNAYSVAYKYLVICAQY